MIRYLPIMLLLFAALGCAMLDTVESTKIPQAEIQQVYRVSADKNGTHAAAIFYHGNWGKTVDLDAPSRIEHNGSEMPQITPNLIKGTTYDVFSEQFQPAHEFVYVNGDGRAFRNRIGFEPIEIGQAEIKIGRTRETVVPLSRAVRENEEISISLSSAEKRPAAVLSNAANAEPAPAGADEYDLTLNGELDGGRAAIVLKPKNLKNFKTGKAVLRIEVARNLDLKEATPAGGSIGYAYRSTADVEVGN